MLVPFVGDFISCLFSHSFLPGVLIWSSEIFLSACNMIACFAVFHLSPTGGESAFQKWLGLILLIFISREIP